MIFFLPAFADSHVLVIQKIGRKFPDDFIFISEHEESGGSRMELPVPSLSQSSKFVEKIRGFKLLPDMFRMPQDHAGPVTVDAVRVQRLRLCLFQHIHIRRFSGGLPEHGLDLFFRTAVIPFSIS